jgi:hypothetical protein
VVEGGGVYEGPLVWVDGRWSRPLEDHRVAVRCCRVTRLMVGTLDQRAEAHPHDSAALPRGGLAMI